MALSAPSVLVTPSNVASTLQAKTSASFTPSANALVMVVVSSSSGASANGTLTASAITSTITGMGTWNVIQQAPGATASSAVYVFYATAPASPPAGTVTVTLGGAPTEAKLGVFQMTGHDTTTPIAGTAGTFTATATAAVTLTQAPTTNDYVIGVAASRNRQTASTAGTGFTMLWSIANTTPSAANSVEYKTGTTSTAADIAGLNTIHNAFMAFVVKAASAPLVWKYYNGTTEVAATVQGVWNGSTVVPATSITRT